MQIIEFKGEKYPGFQAYGNAAQFAIPYANYFCQGAGYDIGCMKKEWSLHWSIPIDMEFEDPDHADVNPSPKPLDLSSHDWSLNSFFFVPLMKLCGNVLEILP